MMCIYNNIAMAIYSRHLSVWLKISDQLKFMMKHGESKNYM